MNAIDIDSERRWLAVPEGFTRKKSRRAITAHIRNDHPVTRRSQQRGNIDIAVNVVGPAVQKYHRRTIARTRFSISNVQNPGIDLLQWAERLVCSRFNRRHSCRLWSCWFVLPRNRLCRTARQQWSSPRCKKAAAIMVDLFDHFSFRSIPFRRNSFICHPCGKNRLSVILQERSRNQRDHLSRSAASPAMSNLLKSTNLILLQHTAYVGWMTTEKIGDVVSRTALLR